LTSRNSRLAGAQFAFGPHALGTDPGALADLQDELQLLAVPLAGPRVVDEEDRDQLALLEDRHVDERACRARLEGRGRLPGAVVLAHVADGDELVALEAVDEGSVVAQPRHARQAFDARRAPVALDVQGLGHRVDGPVAHPADAERLAQDLGRRVAHFLRAAGDAEAVGQQHQAFAPHFREHPVGDVQPFDEDAVDVAGGIADRLVDEIQVPVQRRSARDGLHGVPAAGGGEGLAAGVHLVQQVDEALGHRLRQGVDHPLSQHRPVAHQAGVAGIGQLEDVRRPAQQGHEAGRLLEHLRHALAFAAHVPHRKHLLGGLDHQAEDAGGRPGFVQDRRVVQVHPDRLAAAAPEQRELLVAEVKVPPARPVFMTWSLKSAASGQASRTFMPRMPGWRSPEKAAYASL
jgi:hypothetical protein